MRITRYPSLTEQQFFGCTSAFVDSLAGEFNASSAALRRLEGKAKGGAFAWEMSLDRHRYGALIVLDRWNTLARAFGAHLKLSRAPAILREAEVRVRGAAEILGRANALMDAAEEYSPALVEACLAAFQAANGIFTEERAETDRAAKLGPMLPAEFTEAKRIFQEDLAAR